MSAKSWNFFLCVALLTCFTRGTTPAADRVVLQFKPAGLQGEVTLHSTLDLPVSAMYPEYTVLRSTNLQSWEPIAGPISGHVGVSDEILRDVVPLAGTRAFYRVVANIKLAPADNRVGDAVYGYGTEFARQLQRIGQLSLGDFVSRYAPTNQYLSQIGFDPTTADFWDQFSLDPAVYNATNSTDPRLTDFRLSTNEFAVFQSNGFVVSPRLGGYSFADVFYRIYSDDLPVYFSSDAALHAWHRSYIAMLEELEETYLAPRLQVLVKGMSDQVPALWTQAQGSALLNGVRDADFFLAVAQSLATGTTDYGQLGQGAQIQSALAAINNLQPAFVEMFGVNRKVDFSQFQVRGHYDTSERLRRYFRAVMWCGLIDFRFSGFEFTSLTAFDNSLRELSGAVTMGLLMNRSGQFIDWKQIDSVVQNFVGVPDSLNFAQLGDLLTAANIQGPGDLPDTIAMQSLQSRIMAGQLGVQNIRSGYFWSPLTREQIKLPRSFTFMGQRFVLDGWASSKVVFDDIIWDEDGVPGFEDKVMRRVPSALDIAFSVLGNSQVVPNLAARMARTNLTLADGRAFFRDGLNYQHNLAAARSVVDGQGPEAWTNSIYSSWLACLRELSVPTTDPQYPQAMRTRAWAMKTVNTQLASWTQLRHDTVLYAKQPYTGLILCSYPDGYVEPRPGFWLKMREMALRTKDLASTLPRIGKFVFEPNDSGDTAFTNSLGSIWTNRLQFLDNFAGTMATLQTISEKELARTPLATNEVAFMESLVENQSFPYGGVKTYSGWYPGLFYLNARALHSTVFSPSDRWDALVTDVHTDPQEPRVSDPGSILHEGVGNIHLLMIAVDCGSGDPAVYAGPVLSHYEFELGPTTRETDSQWKSDVRAGNLPPQPDWTSGYLVPGAYSVPSWVY
jgi:hypothetical protein